MGRRAVQVHRSLMQGVKPVVKQHHQHPGAEEGIACGITDGSDEIELSAQTQAVSGGYRARHIAPGTLQSQGLVMQIFGSGVVAGDQNAAGETAFHITAGFTDKRTVSLHQGFLLDISCRNIHSVTIPRTRPISTATIR